MTDQLGPDFDRRLKAGLDRFDGPTPRPEDARFSNVRTTRRRLGPIKLALAAAAAVPVLMIAASVFAGGPDPSLWEQKAVSSFEAATHVVLPSPAPAATRSPQIHSQPTARTLPTNSRHGSPEPSEGSHRQPSPSPTADSGSHDSAAPSPPPGPGSDDGGQQATPSPTPSGWQP